MHIICGGTHSVGVSLTDWNGTRLTSNKHFRPAGKPIPYYSNSYSTFRALLYTAGDIEYNPGPIQNTTRSTTTACDARNNVRQNCRSQGMS